jgi:hypothetical protein
VLVWGNLYEPESSEQKNTFNSQQCVTDFSNLATFRSKRIEARDRNAPTNANQIRLQTSRIRQEHRPIRYQLPARLSFRQGQGVARQISQHRLGSTERSLCIDDPVGFACRRQTCRERVALYQRGVTAEKLQGACLMGRDQLLQEQSAEQPREHAHGQKEAWPA